MKTGTEFEFDASRPERSRRAFLKALVASGAAALAAPGPRVGADEGVVAPEPTADACILLWMGGGMAAPDNFDPKRYVPFEVGTPVEKIISTFPAIDTAVMSSLPTGGHS